MEYRTPTKQYIKALESANDVECLAAAFILHGPLVIGGGAMLKSRVEKAFGVNATKYGIMMQHLQPLLKSAENT